jgi:hypothetical protein
MNTPVALTKMTRLLIQKPVAEPDENAQIALSVLRDAGWTIEQIGLEICISLSRAPYALPGSQEDVNAGAAKALEASRLIVRKLQRDLDRQRGNEWLLATAVAAICAWIAPSLYSWLWLIVALCGFMALIIRWSAHITKGAA